MEIRFHDELDAWIVLNDNGQVDYVTHLNSPFNIQGKSIEEVSINYIAWVREYLGIQMIRKSDTEIVIQENEAYHQVLRFDSIKDNFDHRIVSFLAYVNGTEVFKSGVVLLIEKATLRVYSCSSSIKHSLEFQEYTKDIEWSLSKIKKFISEIRFGNDAISNLNNVQSTRGFYYYDQIQVESNNKGNGRYKVNFPANNPDFKTGICYPVFKVNCDFEVNGNKLSGTSFIDINSGNIIEFSVNSSNLSTKIFDSELARSKELNRNLSINKLLTCAKQNSFDELKGPFPIKLEGEYVTILDQQSNVVSITEPALAGELNYEFGTKEFAYINAYLNHTSFFELVANLGFPKNYWKRIKLPIHVRLCLSLSGDANVDVTNGGTKDIIVNYNFILIGKPDKFFNTSSDWRTVLHELGGHCLLYSQVDGPYLGFSHSAGDCFSAILNDPNVDKNDANRFETFSFMKLDRFHNKVADANWSWRGNNDTGYNTYESEQILSTTVFRIYIAIGGDSKLVEERKQASDYIIYLLIRTIGNLTPIHVCADCSNHKSGAMAFCFEMMIANYGYWAARSLSGGAYGKVIYWAFEEQGMFSNLNTVEDIHLANDIFIDDGRHGGYEYCELNVHNLSVWNRNTDDNEQANEEPIAGQSNYLYVIVSFKNKQMIDKIKMNLFQTKTTKEIKKVIWPMELNVLNQIEIVIDEDILHKGTLVAGPITWTPKDANNTLLVEIVTEQDPSNLSYFSTNYPIQLGRLVPHDNNLALKTFNAKKPDVIA